MNSNKLFPSLLVGGVIGLTLWRCAKSVPAKPVANDNSFGAIDAYVEQQRRRLNVPGVSLAIVQGDKIAHVRGFGRARPHGEIPMTRRRAHSPTQNSLRDDVSPQTPFYVGSLTKSFTALAVMQLVEAGKIELDASVQHYLPWFRVADYGSTARITVRHLLNQTSGIPASSGETVLADSDNRPNATERQMRALAKLTLTRPAGMAFEYSNANYNLLGLIVEAVSGESYAEYVQQHSLNPLQMCHTYTSKALAKKNGLAMGHQYWFTVPIAAPNIPIPHGSLPAGLLISCAEDLAHYLIAFLNGGRFGDAQILSPAGIKELQRGAANVNWMGMSLGQYGMGWFITEIGGTKLAWHSGTLPDFGAYMALLPEQKKGVVLLFNACHHWMNPVLTEFGTGVATLLAGEQPAPRPFSIVIPWILRAQLLLPALQLVGIATTVRLEKRSRQEFPRTMRGVLPLIPNLLAALTLIPLLGKRRGYLKLYMPDLAWLAMIGGSFGLVFSLAQIALLFRQRRFLEKR